MADIGNAGAGTNACLRPTAGGIFDGLFNLVACRALPCGYAILVGILDDRRAVGMRSAEQESRDAA